MSSSSLGSRALTLGGLDQGAAFVDLDGRLQITRVEEIMRARIKRAILRHMRTHRAHMEDELESQMQSAADRVAASYFDSADYALLRSHCLANIRIWRPQTPRALLAALLQIDDACGKYSNATWEQKHAAKDALVVAESKEREASQQLDVDMDGQ